MMFRYPLARRSGLALLILLLECLGLTIAFEARSLGLDGSLIASLLNRSERAVGVLLISIAVFAVIITPKISALKESLRSAHWGTTRALSWLTLHFLLFVLFTFTCYKIFRSESEFAGTGPSTLSFLQFTLLGVATYYSLALTVLPRESWRSVYSILKGELLSAVLVGLACFALGRLTVQSWDFLSDATFYLVEWMLKLIYSDVISNPDEKLIGTQAFAEVIGRGCSGYEGIGLMITFLTFFLWHFRSRLIFPHSLVLVPVGCVAIWLANVLRITLLIIIGDKLSPEIAVGGFHSQAGWFFFCLVAIGIAATSLNSRWLARTTQPKAQEVAGGATVVVYLLPFLSLMAGMIFTGMASSDFDWLYPARIAATGTVLLMLAGKYRQLDWSWSWLAFLTGVATYIAWIAMETPNANGGERLHQAVNSLGSPWDSVWLISRVVGSVIVVPLAEELAFRGYLLRRLISVQFEEVSQEQYSTSALIISSLLFGLMHQRWLAGILAGMIYGLLYWRRGKLCDPILAHVVTNALIALQVLTRGSWHLWT